MGKMVKTERLRVGVLPLARPTFDVPYAKKICKEAWEVMEKLSVYWVGSDELLFDEKSVESQILKFKKEKLDLLLILQMTLREIQ